MRIRRLQPNPPVKVDTLTYQVKLPDAQPQHILEEIVWHKEIEVAKLREKLPLLELRQQVAGLPAPRNFERGLRPGKTKPALIAEVKKASPSRGVIRTNFDPAAIAQSYQQGGASCLSVLTDEKFFQGSFANLALVHQSVDLPILCKEFIIYPYQIYYARARGADAVLLIAAILGDRDLQYFVKIIKSLGMAALVEVHTLEELDRVLNIEGITLVGINNRNLADFSVNLDNTRQLLEARGEQIKKSGILTVSESGLYGAEDIQFVSQAGADAVLIGEFLVKQSEPGKAIAKLFPQSQPGHSSETRRAEKE
jgi:indole-3-glycerol phosphate synthase